MKKLFAVPTINEKLCAHFGHSEQFAVVETEDQKILNVEFFTPPIHQPGTYPRFLAEKGVSTIISGGMGSKAQDIFAQNNIEVFMGIDSDNPEKLVEKYLKDQLKAGDNFCDH
ncbi:MAG: NifB/NifX family molybdenum-iron cluster-binding protein [Bacteroidota bacterium]